MEAPPLAQRYNESKTRPQTSSPRPGSLAAGDLLGCRRRLALRVQGKVAPPRPGAAHLSEGQLHEAEIVRVLKGIGVRVTQTGEKEGWFTMHLSGLRIRGQSDGVLPEVQAVLEVKSVGREKELRAMRSPREGWRAQCEIYMRAWTLPRALIFAKARDTGWARQWWIRADDSLWARMQENVAVVADTGDPWGVDVEYEPECGWCGWKERCWGPEPTIDLGGWRS